MSRRSEVERRMHTMGEISSIMGSMKTLALLETRKLTRFRATQRRVVTTIEAAAADLLRVYPVMPPQPGGARHVFVLLGSERGFCGDYNEALLHALDAHLAEAGEPSPLLIGVGRKLCVKLEDDPRVVGLLDGASAAEEVQAVLTGLIDAISALQEQHGALFLSVVHHREDHDDVQIKLLLPPFQHPSEEARRFPDPPLLNLSPEAFFAELLDHYLFAALYEMFYASLTAENHRRVQHLEGAIRRLDEETDRLALKRNKLRQEEITEEIEVILLSVEATTPR